MIQSPENLIEEHGNVKSGLLATGLDGKVGMLLVTNASGTWEHSAVTNDMSVEVGILIEDKDATATGLEAQIMTNGKVNLAKVIFAGAQTYTQIKGILQDKGIYLTNWRAS